MTGVFGGIRSSGVLLHVTSLPSGRRPNMTVPISQERTPPVSYNATATDWPGYCSGSRCESQARASM